MCPPLLLAQSGQMVRGLFEYATALINVNESAGKRGAGHGAARAEIILSEKERGALQALRRRKIGGRALLILLSLGGLREFIEGESLDRAHGQRAALRSVDLTLHLDLHRKNLIGLADDLHSQSGLVDKRIERQD